jgi:hypothetical protein
MITLREAAQLSLQAIEEGWLFERIDAEVAPALSKALAERQECETCAAKRAKLTEAGLLKSPLREDVPFTPVKLDPAYSVPMRVTQPTFRFVRYVDGKEMAEGVTIMHASTLEEAIQRAVEICPKRPNTVLVYAPPKKEWVGLTDNDIELLDNACWEEDEQFWHGDDFARALEAKLRELNT